ncbi:dynein regulatory complex protein 9 [Carcharodon carcharias]|uniref:dynein regulatory complex protein 9 n=1 Tax=Carcharodon carcharias TaxID=13397 RepID=UPI001B7DA48F|nr:dynein regulatory complex protein 9 [Carcharodon carcharias]
MYGSTVNREDLCKFPETTTTTSTINNGTKGGVEEIQKLSQGDILRICNVLGDCIDQLNILGLIMPVSYEERTDATSIVGNEIDMILKSQKQVESKFQELISSRSEEKESTGNVSRERLAELGEQIKKTAGDLKRSTQLLNISLKQCPLTADNLTKVQADRQFALEVINNTLQELNHSGTFVSLLNVVEWEKKKKIKMQNVIIREEEGRRKIKVLKKQLQNLQKEREAEQQHKNEMIAHLKDQMQEMKAKTAMEGKYMKKNAELQVFQAQKKCADEENKLQEDVQLMKSKIDQEIRIHLEIEKFLKQNQTELEENLEFWMEKYDKDIETKQSELSTLKSNKISDLQRLKEYSEKYLTYERVIIEDRVERENEWKKRTQEEKEFKSIIKLQSWWRGVMVRRGIGIYKYIKRKGGESKGKGKGKGKGKADKKK